VNPLANHRASIAQVGVVAFDIFGTVGRNICRIAKLPSPQQGLLPMRTRPARFAISLAIGGLVALLGGCANVRVDRAAVEKIQKIEMVQVITPALEIPTFLQAAVKSGTLGGVLPAVMAESQGKDTRVAPAIHDVGALLAEKLRASIPQKVSWWPTMTLRQGAVPGNYAHPSGEWLKVKVERYEIAPAPMKTLFVEVEVSLRRAQDRPDPLWVRRLAYSGVVHGGQKIDTDKLPATLPLLNREIERSAEWLAREIASSIQP